MDEDVPPSRPIGAVGATVVLVGFVLGTALGMNVLTHVIAALSGDGLAAAREIVATRPVLAALAQAVAAAAVLAGAKQYYLRGARLAPALGIVDVPRSTIALAALLGASMQIPLAELGNVVEGFAPVPFEQKLRLAALLEPSSLADGLGLVFAVVAIAPVAEELVFRGLLMAGIARGSGIVVGVIISTLGFAVSHGRADAVAVAFVAGLVLAVISVRTESIVPAIVVHAMNNALPVLLSARLVPLAGWNVPTERPTHLPFALVVPLTIVSLATFAKLVEKPRA